MRSDHDAVAHAAATLDKLTPEWFRRVDPAQLDLHSCTACVLGQVYGAWGNGLVALGLATRHLVGEVPFYSIESTSTLEYGGAFVSERCTEHWVEEIAARLFPEGAPRPAVQEQEVPV